jgi:hypothetical protein
MSLFTLTINNFATPLDKQHQEVQRIHSYLNLATQDVRAAGGKHTSWNILGTPEQPSSAVALARHKHLRSSKAALKSLRANDCQLRARSRSPERPERGHPAASEKIP